MMSIASCTKSEDMIDPNAAGGMTLRFVSNTLTRAEGTNDNQNSEDDIKTVDIYFYAGDGSSAAVSHVAPDITDGEDGNASLRGENELKLTSGVVNSLFPAGGSASATLYVVANAPAGLLPTSGTLPTLAELKSITSELTSWKTSAEGAAPSSYQTSFLMDGSATFQKSTQELTIELTRAAAKFDLEISSIEDEVNIEIAGGVTETWEPVIDAEHPVTVSFANALRSTRVDGKFVGSNAKNTYDSSQKSYGFTSSTTNGVTSYTQTHPFYSYASDWGDESADEPYLLLTVYWKKNNEEPEATYYQIPVGSIADKQIKRNNHYKIKINVGTVGSQEESAPVPLEANYTVIDWSTGTITANIKEARYLVVDQTKVVLNNLEDVSVAFQSSHEVEYKIVSHTFNTVYSNNGNTWNTVLGFNTTSSEGTGYVKQEGGKTAGTDGKFSGSIDFHHELDNTRIESTGDPARRYDYQVNTVTIKVYHKGYENTYYETITIEQRPALYVQYEDSIDYVMVNNKTSAQNSDWQYVIASPISGTNLYTVTVSAFDASTSDFIITDPREPMNNDIFVFDESTSLDDTGDNTLTGYRATIEGAPSKNLVAPSFIIASSYGAYRSNYDLHASNTAKYRCAAYQEAGYPAGRWRLPTPAELKVVAQLCVEGKMDNIFYSRYDYASSDVPYKYDDSNKIITESTRADRLANSVRCVYDIWYWKDKCDDPEDFIWGAEGDNLEAKRASGHLVMIE